MSQRRSAEEIRQLLNHYRERGELTRRAFCDSRGIRLPTLDYYLRRYATPATPLSRVRLTAPGNLRALTLAVGNGRRIECGEAGLAQLIRIAESL